MSVAGLCDLVSCPSLNLFSTKIKCVFINHHFVVSLKDYSDLQVCEE